MDATSDGMDTVRYDNRYDYKTAHIVDAVVMYLTADGSVANAMHYMNRHAISSSVQNRVLKNTATIRRKSLVYLQHCTLRMMEIEIGR